MELLERILGVYTVSIYRESKRFIEIKSLVFLLELLMGARRLALIYYFSIISFVLFTAGIFMVVIQGLNQFQNEGGIYFDFVIMLGIVLALSCGSLSLWFLSEKRWLSACQVQDRIQEAIGGPATHFPQETNRMSRDELKQLIDELIGERLKS